MWLHSLGSAPFVFHCVCMFMCVCQGGLTASAVRHLVALQSEEIKLVASEYAEKVAPPSSLNSIPCAPAVR